MFPLVGETALLRWKRKRVQNVGVTRNLKLHRRPLEALTNETQNSFRAKRGKQQKTNIGSSTNRSLKTNLLLWTSEKIRDSIGQVRTGHGGKQPQPAHI